MLTTEYMNPLQAVVIWSFVGACMWAALGYAINIQHWWQF